MALPVRKQYAGAAASTTTTNALAPADTSVTLASTTGWPSAASTPFYVVLSPGTSAEEKCRATISGSTLTLTRAQDGTTAQSHSSGTTVYPVFTALEADEANEVASKLTTKGDLLTTNGSDLNRLAVGTNDHVLSADSAATNGMKWAQVVAGGIASNAVTTAKILDANVTTAKIADANVTTAKIADANVTTAKIADANVTPAKLSSDVVQGPRNVIINGAMQVHQRGTSTASITTAGYYTTDRFHVDISSAGTWTMSSQNDAPTGSGFRKSLRMLCTTIDGSLSAGDYLFVNTKLEGQNLQNFRKGTSSARQFVLSFWVRSTTTGTYVARLLDVDNTRHVSATYSISAANTWEQKTITFPADTTGAFDNDNASSLVVQFWLAAGTNFTSGTLATTWASVTAANNAVGQLNLAATLNNDWSITGVQLEAGPTATPFEFEDYGTTLDKCQRYFERVEGATIDSVFGTGVAYSSTAPILVFSWQVEKRADAALSFSGTWELVDGGNVRGFSSLTSSTNTRKIAQIGGTVSGMTTGQALVWRAGSDIPYIDVAAEL